MAVVTFVSHDGEKYEAPLAEGQSLMQVAVNNAVPGIDGGALRNFMEQAQAGIGGILSMFTGGALGRMGVFALGIMPYISASIIVQLLTSMVPSLEQLKKEGEQGRKNALIGAGIGAGIGHHHRRVGAREGTAEVDDADAGQRTSSGRGCFHQRPPMSFRPTVMSTITDVIRRTWMVSTIGTFAPAVADIAPICAIPPGAVASSAVIESRLANFHSSTAATNPKTRKATTVTTIGTAADFNCDNVSRLTVAPSSHPIRT